MIGATDGSPCGTSEARGEFILLLGASEPHLQANVMKNLANYIFPVLLIILGGALLIVGAMQGQNTWVMLGAGLALIAGLVSVMLQLGLISRKGGMILGVVFALLAVVLAYRNYRSVVEVIEFNEKKLANDRLVIQGLKDMRTAQLGYKEAFGGYTGNLEVLAEFVQKGHIPMIKAIGQVPDTLSELEALELGIIVRDTILAPALDSLFLSPRVQDGRAYPFDPNTFTKAPSGAPFLLKAGVINSSGRNVPVFLVRDPQPMVKGDTLLVGNMDKASTSGNWTGE
jgi:hypothetical protein